MRHGKLSRQEAINIVGKEAVENVEKENCQFTNRVQTDGDTAVEFMASVTAVDREGNFCTLEAYYYQDEDVVNNTEDLSSLDWEIEGYEIV